MLYLVTLTAFHPQCGHDLVSLKSVIKAKRIKQTKDYCCKTGGCHNFLDSSLFTTFVYVLSSLFNEYTLTAWKVFIKKYLDSWFCNIIWISSIEDHHWRCLLWKLSIRLKYSISYLTVWNTISQPLMASSKLLGWCKYVNILKLFDELEKTFSRSAWQELNYDSILTRVKHTLNNCSWPVAPGKDLRYDMLEDSGSRTVPWTYQKQRQLQIAYLHFRL